MIINVSGRGFPKRSQNLCTGFISNGKLEVSQKFHGKRIKIDKGVSWQLNIPFFLEPVSVLWKSCNRMESSIKEFEEHQRWKVITWLLGSSLGFPFELGDVRR
jgi:hypothetical protein